MNCRKPAGPRHRRSLRIGDRNQAHVTEFAEEWVQIRNIKPSMKRRDSRNLQPAYLRKRQVIEMKMNDVKLICLLPNRFDQIEVVSQGRKQFAAFQSQRPFAN